MKQGLTTTTIKLIDWNADKKTDNQDFRIFEYHLSFVFNVLKPNFFL